MRNCHGRVARVGVALHKDAHWQAHDLAAADYHAMLTARFDSCADQHFQNAEWCCGNVSGQAFAHSANIDRMETVHVFRRVYSFHYRVFRNVFWKRQLNDKTVHIRIVVQGFYCFKKLCLGCVGVKTQQGGSKADFFAATDFGSYVSFAGTVLSHEDCSQVRLFATSGHPLFNLGLDFRFYLGRNSFPVE
ncbi:hypothetical protein D3C87_1519300 [compost metagenome]